MQYSQFCRRAVAALPADNDSSADSLSSSSNFVSLWWIWAFSCATAISLHGVDIKVRGKRTRRKAPFAGGRRENEGNLRHEEGAACPCEGGERMRLLQRGANKRESYL